MVDRRAASREAFFESLPPNEFAPWETALRQALLDCLHVKSGAFPLIEWIDRRLGGEIATSRDETGQGEIAPIHAGAPAPRASPEAFLSGLPTDSFMPEEEALREAIFDFLAAWKSQELANLSNLSADRAVQDCRRALLPAEVPLADWIERRIGGEVELRKDAKGQFIIHLTPAARPIVTAKYEAMLAAGRGAAMPPRRDGFAAKGAGKGIVSPDAWLASLPVNELSREEAAFRQALLDWLHNWPKWRPANRRSNALLGEAMQDPEVHRCAAALLPPGVPPRDWIDRRIGGEVEVRVNGSGQPEILLRNAQPAQDASPAAGASSAEAADLFFSGLPEDELTPEELALRQAVLDYLDAAADLGTPLLTDLNKDRAVRESRTALLPPEVPLRLWLERRIGGEVEVSREEQGVCVRYRGAPRPAGTKEDVKEEKERFFESLPADQFTDDEEKLREAILQFLDQSDKEQPPTLLQASNDAEVRKLRMLVLPPGAPVSIKDWIERRMGGEVEMLPDVGGQLLIGIRGELSRVLERKRRADPAGKGQSGGGKSPAGVPTPGSAAWKRPRLGGNEGKGPGGRLPPRG